MRVKKQKQVRKSVRFYKTCCGFREPFKVLCDGQFVHDVLSARIGSLHDAFPALLGEGSKVYVTRCVIAELKTLGEDFTGTVLATRRLEIATCIHNPPLPTIDCLESMVGRNNPEHFFVATQSAELRRRLRKVEGGALIFLQNTGLILESPSRFQQSYARLGEADRLHLAQRELKLLEDRSKQRATQVSMSEAGTNGAQEQKSDEVKEVTRLKRHRAKGPNPLSQKKKKKNSTGAVVQQVPSENDSLMEKTIEKTKRQRHRKRRKKSVSDGPLSAEGSVNLILEDKKLVRP